METTPVGKPLLESVIRQLTYWNISVVTHAAPALKTAVSSQKSAGMEKASAKFDKGSVVNWNCVFDANEFISFCPPLLFRFCTGSYTYTEILMQRVVGVMKVRFRDKLWRCKKGNRKIIQLFYCCSNMYFDTITLCEWIFTLRLVKGTACWWQVETELRIASKVFGEIDKLLEG